MQNKQKERTTKAKFSIKKKMKKVIIIGAGPAGLAAGLYAGRARLNTLIIEKQKNGGQIVITSEIENYPGGLEEETGPSLIDRMVAQTQRFGVDHVFDTVTDVELEGEEKIIKCLHEEYSAKVVIIAAGANPVPIGCPGEKELSGKGVSYCATCDGAFFEDFEVYVVGGGDSAVEEAMYVPTPECLVLAESEALSSSYRVYIITEPLVLRCRISHDLVHQRSSE